MAQSYKIVRRGVAGNLRINIVDVTLDAAYAAGGYVLDAKQLGVASIDLVIPEVITGEKVSATWVKSTGAVLMLKGASTVTVTTGSAAFTELATNDTLVSATTVVRCVVYGDAPTG